MTSLNFYLCLLVPLCSCTSVQLFICTVPKLSQSSPIFSCDKALIKASFLIWDSKTLAWSLLRWTTNLTESALYNITHRSENISKNDEIFTLTSYKRRFPRNIRWYCTWVLPNWHINVRMFRDCATMYTCCTVDLFGHLTIFKNQSHWKQQWQGAQRGNVGPIEIGSIIFIRAAHGHSF